MHKIGIVTPTRGDRPKLLEQCANYLYSQTLKRFYWSLVDYKPKDKNKDLVQRCEVGIQDCIDNNCDLIFFIEDDDYYSPVYLKCMYDRWVETGKPELFGIGETTYYHLKTNKYWNKKHPRHSSLMCTMITKQAAERIDYKKVKGIWFDIYLWNTFKGVTTTFKNDICLGIKHGIGVTGGVGHNPNASIYNQLDFDGSYLRNIVGIYNYKFYNELL